MAALDVYYELNLDENEYQVFVVDEAGTRVKQASFLNETDAQYFVECLAEELDL